MFQPPTTPSEHHDLEQLKRQAKDLLKASKAGEKPALDLVRLHYRQVPHGGISLTAAQLVIARHHGFESWAKLRTHVERVHLRRLIKAVQSGNLAEAKDLLHQRPELVHLDVAENNEHRALHYAVLRRDEPMVRLLMVSGADAHKGIFPHRDATTAYLLAKERGFENIVAAIEEEEQTLRQGRSCSNATVSLVAQDILFDKIRRGEEAAAIAQLEGDPELTHACDRDGGTPLHIACEEGALKIIDWLLLGAANPVDPRKEDAKGRTPLDRGTMVRWKERDRRREEIPKIARRLLRHGAPMSPLIATALGDIEALRTSEPTTWGGANLLSTAVFFGHIETVRYLLDLGLDPDEKAKLPNLDEEVSSRGYPLWLAAAFGEHEIARLLLERGANPMGEVYASGTPVDRAYGARDERMKRLLADHGGQPSAFTIGGNRDIVGAQRLLDHNPTESTVRDLLWAAACGGEPEIVRMCLPKIPWQPDDPRWHSILVQPLRIHLHSPVSEHPEFFDRSTYPECLRLILNHGVDINLPGKYGATLMHCIAAEGKCWGIEVMMTDERLEFARIALDTLPDLALRDELLKSTPLGWACRWGRLELVELLLERGCPAQEPEAEPWATPLAWASKMNHPEIGALLRNREATR